MQGLQESRIKKLNDRSQRNGTYVLYWMQQSQRAEFNHALEYAVEQANRLKSPLVVAFGLMPDYPEANRRHYRFLLEGLEETERRLAERGIKLVIRYGEPWKVVRDLSDRASLVVCDRGYLRHQKVWRQKLARALECPLIQIESDVVVPVEEASRKAEYAARTIRPKINRRLDEFLVGLEEREARFPSLDFDWETVDLSALEETLEDLGVTQGPPSVSSFFRGGAAKGRARFEKFLEESLPHYVENRNQPQTDHVSHVSPYLHFGQISPLYLALAARRLHGDCPEGVDTFLEELIVRRELSMNFVEHSEDYDDYGCLPSWALETLHHHRDDPREFLYSREELEGARTHDPYWNAAMREMRATGFMHNYMRMYWGKKILEWSEAPEKAFDRALAINNQYFLDGRDPNSFAGVAWIFGLHDRPWGERPVFGKTRYMNAAGLRRKCDIDAYVEKVDRLVQKADEEGIARGRSLS